MDLTNDNYYSPDANQEYLSASQFKDFIGSYGKKGCEYCAFEKLAGKWEEEPSTAMLVGSYVDSYFEGTLDDFKHQHPDILKRDGSLKADFVKADEIISRVQKDSLFMQYMSGEKQVIMTGNIAGAKWKIKMDSYVPDKCIVDLKVMSGFKPLWVRDVGYLDFVRYWGYDIQGAIYQDIVRQNTGKRLPFYIAAVTKEKEPDIAIIHVSDNFLDDAMSIVTQNTQRIVDIKNYDVVPDRCEICDCCKNTKVIMKPISILDLMNEA